MTEEVTMQTVLDAVRFFGHTLTVVDTPQGKRIKVDPLPVPEIGAGITRYRDSIIAHLESTKPVKTEHVLLEERIVKGWGWLFEREQAGETDAEYERVLAGWKHLLERYDNEGVA